MVTNTTELKASAEALLVETGEKRDRLGRRITPRVRRAELVAAWRQSGLTQAEFARREGVIYSSFAAWVQAERRVVREVRRPQPLAGKPAPIRFAEIKLPGPGASAPGLEVRLPDGTVVRGTNGTELAKLVRALRS